MALGRLGPKKGAKIGGQNRTSNRPKMPLGAQESPRGRRGAIFYHFLSNLGSIRARFSTLFVRNASVRNSIQQHCKAAVWQSCAGPATGAHAPIRYYHSTRAHIAPCIGLSTGFLAPPLHPSTPWGAIRPMILFCFTISISSTTIVVL